MEIIQNSVMYNVRNAKEADLPKIAELINKEKTRKTSANTLRACFLADPDGWFVSEINGDQIIGVIAGCRMSDDLASGGYFLVQSNWRRRGVGRSLWERRIEYCSNLTLSINAVDARVKLNKKHGFSLPEKQIFVRKCDGEVEPGTVASIDVRGVSISPLVEHLFPQLEAYDTRIHAGVRRVNMLTQWLDPSVTTTLVALHDDVMVGYGAVQPVVNDLAIDDSGREMSSNECSTQRTTYHLGPLFANSDQIADALFSHLVNSLPGRVDITWDCNFGKDHVQEINRKYGFEVKLKMNKMFHGKAPEIDTDCVYGFTWSGISLI